MAALTIADLTIEYDQTDYVVRPIEDLNVAAADGDIVILLGPSGSGKTTLLSCIAGILRPARGTITAGDTVVTSLQGAKLTEFRRFGVGIIFQAFNLIPSLTARQNVEAPMRLAGIRRSAARARAEELLTRVGLADRMHHLPGALSGGQQQRVAIARALVHDPPLIVADEPTAHLDYVQVEGVLKLLRGLAVPGRLVVVATHDERFTPLADRVVELSPKAVAEERPPVDVALSPGEVLFEQGQPADLVYVVRSGEIEIFRRTADGRDARVTTNGPGEYFGEMGPALHLPRSASARAIEPTLLTAFTIREFRRWHSSANVSPSPEVAT